MFGFFPSSIHIFMDVAWDDNNKVTNEIYWVLVFRSQGLHWLVTMSKYRIIEDQLFKKSHNTIITLGIVSFVANITLHVIDVNKEPSEDACNFPLPKSTFIELGDLFDEDETFFPYLKMNFFRFWCAIGFLCFCFTMFVENFNNIDGPKTFGVFSVVNSLNVMSFIFNASNKLKTSNYDTHDVPCFFSEIQ